MGERSDFNAFVAAHYRGEMTLGEFFRRVRPVLERLGMNLMRRWRSPPSVDLDDVVQELMIGCIRAFKRYDPSHPKAPRIDVYVTYGACDGAKKWLHRQRGAKLHGNADAEPGRYALFFEDLAARGRDEPGGEVEWLSQFLQSEADQDAFCQRRDLWRRHLEVAPTVRLRWGLLALHATSGERALAAKKLYGNVDLRMRLRLGSERDARKVIKETLRYLLVA